MKQWIPHYFSLSFQTGCVFWPIVQCLNFKWIPTRYKAIYVATVGFFWTNIVCYIKSCNDGKECCFLMADVLIFFAFNASFYIKCLLVLDIFSDQRQVPHQRKLRI